MSTNKMTKMNSKFPFSKKSVDGTSRKESTGPTTNKSMLLSKLRKHLPSKTVSRRFRRGMTSTGQKKYNKINKDRAVVAVAVPASDEIAATSTFESDVSSFSGSPVRTTSTTTTTICIEGGSGADDLNVAEAQNAGNSASNINLNNHKTTADEKATAAKDNAETKDLLLASIDERKMTKPVLTMPEESVDRQLGNIENDFMESAEEQSLTDCSSILRMEEKTNKDNIVSFKEALIAPLIMMAFIVALIWIMSSIHQVSNI